MTVRKWGIETLVNTNVSDDQFGSEVAALTEGGYVVSWSDADAAGGDGSGDSVKFQRYDAVGAKIGGEVVANFGAAGNQFNRSIAATNDGGYVVVWTDTGTTEYRRFNANGTAGDAGDRDLALAGDQFNPDVATLGSGFIVAFQDSSGNQDIRVQRFLANGDTNGTVIDVATSGNIETAPAIAELAGGGFAVAWDDDTTGNVLVRAFDAAGVQTIAAFPVSANASDASITALAAGNFVVAWTDSTDSSVRARLVFFGGVGDIFTVSTHAAGFQETPSLAALPDGGFVAVYESQGDLRGQVFDAFGARNGGEFVVNTSTDAGQTAAAVTALADGRFVVTWSDAGGRPDDPDAHAIRQQIFDPRDGVVTGTEAGETLLGHDLGNDEINGLGGFDTLNGLGGSDNLYGGDDGDTYIVGAGDQVFESSGGGTDLVQSSVSFTLGANVENLTLTGAGKINASGNALANLLIGNAGANVLAGGLGTDTMTGGGAADRFDFNTIAESAVGAGRDVIGGFSHAQHDRIDLATIDANQTAGHAGNQAFVFIGTQAFAAHAGSGEVRRGPGGVIQINVDADNAPEMEIGAAGALVAADFVL